MHDKMLIIENTCTKPKSKSKNYLKATQYIGSRSMNQHYELPFVFPSAIQFRVLIVYLVL